MTADLAKSPMPDPDANAVAWFIRDRNKGVPGKAFSPDTATADLKTARHLSRFNFTIQPLVLRETMEAEIERLHKQLETANGEIAMLRRVLSIWESRGCPDCGGDCASANPPVSSCIMRETHEALHSGKKS